MKNLCKKIITFTLVLCMALSVFTGVVYAKDNNTIVILYENDVHCAVEGYSKLAAMKNELIGKSCFRAQETVCLIPDFDVVIVLFLCNAFRVNHTLIGERSILSTKYII